jgi:hypothetical protein
MDVSELFTVSNFAAVLTITADSACVWDTPDVTPLSRLDYVERTAPSRSTMDRDTTDIDEDPQARPSAGDVGALRCTSIIASLTVAARQRVR